MALDPQKLFHQEQIWLSTQVSISHEEAKTVFFDDEEISHLLATDRELKSICKEIGGEIKKEFGVEYDTSTEVGVGLEDKIVARCVWVRFGYPKKSKDDPTIKLNLGEQELIEKISSRFWDKFERPNQMVEEFQENVGKGYEPRFKIEPQRPGDIACNSETEVKWGQRLHKALAKDAKNDVDHVTVQGASGNKLAFTPAKMPEPFKVSQETVKEVGVPHCLCEEKTPYTGKIKQWKSNYAFSPEWLPVLAEAQSEDRPVMMVLAKHSQSDGQVVYELQRVEDPPAQEEPSGPEGPPDDGQESLWPDGE